MNVNFHTGSTAIDSMAGTLTPERAVRDKKAWDDAVAWLSARSPRFKTMYDEILAYSHVSDAYVVACEDGPFTQGKYFSPDETGGWPGLLSGKPVVVLTLRGAVTVSFVNANRLTLIGEGNSDLFGNTRWSDVDRTTVPLPTGWTCTAPKPVQRRFAVQSPLMGVAHELGHLWQWVRFRNGYTAVADRAVRSGQAMGNDFLRIEMNNIINNESVIALEMGEGVRFSYEYAGTAFKDDFLYNLPELTGTLPVLSHARADWPARLSARVYGQSQLEAGLTYASAGILELTPDFPCKLLSA
jgi:hypothetical protein